MDELLQKIKERIAGHRERFATNETAVRRQLIEPLMDWLGWQTDDPTLVLLNDKTDDRDIPDYSLMKNKRVETYIEAKNLSANIIDHLPQLARYCINNGKEFGIITNGNDWLLIKTFEKDTKPKDRIIWQISVERDNINTIKTRLLNISTEQIGNLPELIEKEKQIQKFWEQYASNSSRILDKIANEMSSDFLSKYPDDDYEEQTILDFFKSKLSGLIGDKINVETNNTEVSTNRAPKKEYNYTLTTLKKLGTPSVKDWVEQIPELRRHSGLNSWRDICDHLRIPVEGDSARRKIKRWVENNKPNWPNVPDPKK